ncbi:hypothetical protein J6590_039593 [Homalodisca vitripennis]|nr:hypothetical protein J6590_039593 [Homalodisca vitripennis]
MSMGCDSPPPGTITQEPSDHPALPVARGVVPSKNHETDGARCCFASTSIIGTSTILWPFRRLIVA